MSVTKATEANKITEANPKQRSKNTPEECAVIAKAWAEGKDIEYWSAMHKEWRPKSTPKSAPGFSHNLYRVKPEPRTFELWIHPKGGLIGNVRLDYEEMYKKAGWIKIKAKEIV